MPIWLKDPPKQQHGRPTPTLDKGSFDTLRNFLKLPKGTSRLARSIVITLALLGLAGGGYYYLYQQERQTEFHAQRFRTLHTLAQNLQDAYPQFKIAQGTLKSGTSEIPFDTLKVFTETLAPQIWQRYTQEGGSAQMDGHPGLFMALNLGPADGAASPADTFDDTQQIGQTPVWQYTHPFIIDGQPYALKGAVSQQLGNKTIRRLNIWHLVLVVMGVFVVVASLPILKLLIITKVEAFNSSDVVLLGLSILVGAPLVLAMVLALFQYGHFYNELLPDRLEHMAEELDGRLADEVHDMLNQLAAIDNPQLGYDSLNTLYAHGMPPNETWPFTLAQDLAGPAWRFSPFNEVVWINQQGRQQIQVRSYGPVELERTRSLVKPKWPAILSAGT